MVWIRLHQSVRDHRKILGAAAELDVPEPHLVGHLVLLWLWVAENSPSGALPESPEIIARAAGWNGNPDQFVQALIDAALIDRLEGRLVVHDWLDYAGGPLAERGREALLPEMRASILARDGYRCWYCGATSDLTIDHVIPLARGGSNDEDNLVTACRRCNTSKGARTPEEWRGRG